MSEKLTILKDAMFIDEAAKEIRMRRETLKEICRAAGILIPWGGGAKRKRYKVKLSDAENAVMAERHREQFKEQKESRTRRQSGALHPLVRC